MSLYFHIVRLLIAIKAMEMPTMKNVRQKYQQILIYGPI